MKKFIRTTLQGLLNSLDTGFGKDELAYLSSQGKNELQIRDKIAWRLHNNIIAEFGNEKDVLYCPSIHIVLLYSIFPSSEPSIRSIQSAIYCASGTVVSRRVQARCAENAHSCRGKSYLQGRRYVLRFP